MKPNSTWLITKMKKIMMMIRWVKVRSNSLRILIKMIPKSFLFFARFVIFLDSTMKVTDLDVLKLF